jgi:hypothetical protein
MREKEIKNRIQLALGRLQVVTFNNPVGFDHVRKIHFGLCEGSSDLIGWVPRIVTPEMVGSRVAVFLAIETKTKRGVVSNEQQSFIDAVNEAGGKAFVARGVEEAVRKLREGE